MAVLRGAALRACLFVLACLFAPAARAQQMPQDNWRYDGLQFSSPTPANYLRSIAIGSGGVYVGEGTTNGSAATKVIQFTEGGVFVRRLTPAFTFILGLACDPAGNVYVLDRGDSRVKMYAADGTFIRPWGAAGSADGQFSFVSSSRMTMLAVDNNSQIYVCDPGNTRVQVFDSNGNFLRKWGQLGTLPGQFTASSPYGIAASLDGKVYVNSGASGDRLAIFDPNGNYLSSRLVGGSSILSNLAVSSDGLHCIPSTNGVFAVFDASGVAVHSISNPALPLHEGTAFSKRGDIFGIGGQTVRALEREYSSVQNSLLPAIPQPIVLASSQRTGTSWLDIDYQVTDADSATVTTGGLVFKNGGNTLADVVQMNTFQEGTGANLGLSQPTNVSRRLTWNMAADWSVDFAQIQAEVLAKDSRNLLGVHWITVPASGGDPAVQVSSRPVTNAELTDLWYWFLASHQPGITFSNGTLTGTTGLYTSQRLAWSPTPTTNATTTAGRLFAHEQVGVRPINGTEYLRAKAGNYGFASVDANSIVRATALATRFLEGCGRSGSGQINLGQASVGVLKIAAGGDTSFFIDTSNALWALGRNSEGQLGDGTTTTPSTPVSVATGVSQVATIGSHTLFVKTDGTLWATGYNAYGQLGDGTTTNRSTPVQVASGVSQVAAGSVHSLFVKTDGTLWAMGYNGHGQLGNGTTTDQSTPVQVATGVSQVAAGVNHSLFVKTDGTLRAMGNNESGQLGNGTTTSRSTPAQIATGVSQVTAGQYHTLFIKTGGTLWAMGGNGYGQLGDGTTTDRSMPVQIATGVSQVTAGQFHTLFIKIGGTLWAMGNNGYGQLGDGTTTDRTTPIQVRSNVSGVAAGNYHSLAIITAP